MSSLNFSFSLIFLSKLRLLDFLGFAFGFETVFVSFGGALGPQGALLLLKLNCLPFA